MLFGLDTVTGEDTKGVTAATSVITTGGVKEILTEGTKEIVAEDVKKIVGTRTNESAVHPGRENKTTVTVGIGTT